VAGTPVQAPVAVFTYCRRRLSSARRSCSRDVVVRPGRRVVS
jgi:hypothetical protein